MYCLIAPRNGVALVPCGHSRFYGTCADTVAAMNSGCPSCRTPITTVLRLFNQRTTEQLWTLCIICSGFCV